jgi:hypothetical protein
VSPSDYRRACERIAAHLLACAIAGGALTAIMRLAETIHMARPAEERDDSIEVLIGHSADALARLDAHELASIEARLRSLYAHEVGEDAP